MKRLYFLSLFTVTSKRISAFGLHKQTDLVELWMIELTPVILFVDPAENGLFNFAKNIAFFIFLLGSERRLMPVPP